MPQAAKDDQRVTVDSSLSGQVPVENRFQRQNVCQITALSPWQALNPETGSTRQQGAGGLLSVSFCQLLNAS
jgi:hypothetical protein